jgi:hypothetical protein
MTRPPSIVGSESRPLTHPSTLALERYAAADLVGEAQRAVANHLDDCGRCRQILQVMQFENRQFATITEISEPIDALLLASGVTPTRANGFRKPHVGWAIAGSSAIAVAAGLILAFWAWRPFAEVEELDGRSKGNTWFEVVRRTPQGQIDWIDANQPLHPGDAIRFRLRPPTAGYVAVLGFDAVQMITVYAPAGLVLDPIASGSAVLLDGSIVLDATLGPELLVALVCPAPRVLDLVIAQARRSLALASGDPRLFGRISEDCEQSSLMIHKVALTRVQESIP